MTTLQSDAVREQVGPYTVLLSMKAPDGSTRFVDQVIHRPPADQSFLFFSWRTALFGRYDIFHVHWPEWLARHQRWYVQCVYQCLFVLLLIRLRFTSVIVVRTIHNVEPHEPGGRVERLLVSALESRTDDWIVLNPFTTTRPAAVIPHGHYVDRFEPVAKNDSENGLLVFFGRIDRYKNVPTLIDVFSRMGNHGEKLRIVGNPTAEVRALIEPAVDKRENVTALLEYVSDETLVAEVSAAHLVVLPYTEMHNSGAVFVALSLGRPVLVPDSEMARWISGEVGSEWVQTYRQLLPHTLEEALRATEHLTSGGSRPELESRDWQAVSNAHAEFYRRNIARRKS